MMENLAEMAQTTEPINPTTLNVLDKPAEETQQESAAPTPVTEPEEPVETLPERAVPILNLPEWFTKYSDNVEVKPVKIVIKGVNPDNILIVSYPTGVTLEDGSDEKDVELFKRANRIPALDLPASVVNVYSSSFRMVHDYGDGVWVKTYGLKTNLIMAFCVNVNDVLIPFSIEKVKRKNKIVVIPTYTNLDALAQKLGEPCNLEALELRYKQSKGITAATNLDVVTWLFDKQKEIADINHHLQVDSVIMSTLA